MNLDGLYLPQTDEQVSGMGWKGGSPWTHVAHPDTWGSSPAGKNLLELDSTPKRWHVRGLHHNARVCSVRAC